MLGLYPLKSKQDFVGWETTKLIIVRCALIQPKGYEDWRRTNSFYTYIKCGDKECKIIIDS